MIHIVQIPIGFVQSREEAFLMSMKNEMENYRKKNAEYQAEMCDELDEYISDGYEIISYSQIEISSHILMVFFLRKPD